MSDSQCSGSIAPFRQESDCGRMRSLVRINALYCLSAGWGQESYVACKNVVPLIHRGSLLEQVEEYPNGTG